ncbi:hypothetical protein H1R20_g9316, partial [Candolleomyces eurysporus]
MGRRVKYHMQEECRGACHKHHSGKALTPGFKEARRAKNRRAYAKRKTVVIPEPLDIVLALASTEIVEYKYEHLFAHYSVIGDPLELANITLTNTDFQKMSGCPPYPAHILNLNSFEKDWPIILAMIQGYATRMYVLDQTTLMKRAVDGDQASLSSELSKVYSILMADWKIFGDTVRDNPHDLPTEFLAHQGRLWTSWHLTWLVNDIGCLAEGVEVFLAALEERIRAFK